MTYSEGFITVRPRKQDWDIPGVISLDTGLCRYFRYEALTYRLFSYLSIFLLLMSWFHLSPTRGFCSETLNRDVRDHPCSEPAAGEESGSNIGTWLASFFRDHISAVDGNRCPSMPTCSAYSVQAFEKHGFFIGWVMTVDRLIHEGEEASVSPLVRHNGTPKILDPVENNDFWWYDGEEPGDD